MSTDWLHDVVKVLEAETDDLIQLCELAGGDLATFYSADDLDGVSVSPTERQRLIRAMYSKDAEPPQWLTAFESMSEVHRNLIAFLALGGDDGFPIELLSEETEFSGPQKWFLDNFGAGQPYDFERYIKSEIGDWNNDSETFKLHNDLRKFILGEMVFIRFAERFKTLK